MRWADDGAEGPIERSPSDAGNDFDIRISDLNSVRSVRCDSGCWQMLAVQRLDKMPGPRYANGWYTSKNNVNEVTKNRMMQVCIGIPLGLGFGTQNPKEIFPSFSISQPRHPRLASLFPHTVTGSWMVRLHWNQGLIEEPQSAMAEYTSKMYND